LMSINIAHFENDVRGQYGSVSDQRGGQYVAGMKTH